MPQITINGKTCEFQPGQMILQIANANGVEIPQYCYHDALSIPASCRICLAEVWAPNPRNNNALEPYMGGKLMPTCQTAAADGMVVYTDSPKAVQNQKAVMEYLLINHPLDCPVCDQSGECFLQDYSYEYGRGVSRFEETKIKNPKKDVGPHVYLYADRCIMCTRCVRFTREVTGTAELHVQGRGNKEEIDVFPGVPLDNELSVNVVDLCPVGALLEKDFLFAQRVWFLKETPSIDGVTASGDNITIHHNEGRVYRIKPRTNMNVNGWWISDEIRYGWKHVHDERRLRTPMHRQFGVQVPCEWARAIQDAVDGIRAAIGASPSPSSSGNGQRSGSGRLALMVSPMLPCEEAFVLGQAAQALDPNAVLALGPVPVHGQDKTYPGGKSMPNGYTVYAEKCPNRRGVTRVLTALSEKSPARGAVSTYEQLLERLRSRQISAVILTGNYPSDWVTDDLLRALEGVFVVLIDTLDSRLVKRADIVLPGATWVEKAGTFQNAKDLLQAFEAAIPVIEGAKQEGEIAAELIAAARLGVGAEIPAGSPGPFDDGAEGGPMSLDIPGREQATLTTYPGADSSRRRRMFFNAADTRRRMAAFAPALAAFTTDVKMPTVEVHHEPDMQVVEL